VDGQLVRAVDLATVLGASTDDAPVKPALVISEGTRRRAVLVDEVLGQREYIEQPLSWNLAGASTVAGTTVLDGGSVVLVLDSRTLLGSRAATGGWSETKEVRQYRLLVVDDSTTSRTLERNILRSAGYDVMTAVDGQEALEILRDNQIDLVVSDVEMPSVNGLELTRSIRRDPGLEHLPVILVTNLESEEHQQDGAEAGADSYIIKGAFDQDELLHTVARLL
jgi:two-component system chemotaxis sensor kinase CheA